MKQFESYSKHYPTPILVHYIPSEQQGLSVHISTLKRVSMVRYKTGIADEIQLHREFNPVWGRNSEEADIFQGQERVREFHVVSGKSEKLAISQEILFLFMICMDISEIRIVM